MKKQWKWLLTAVGLVVVLVVATLLYRNLSNRYSSETTTRTTTTEAETVEDEETDVFEETSAFEETEPVEEEPPAAEEPAAPPVEQTAAATQAAGVQTGTATIDQATIDQVLALVGQTNTAAVQTTAAGTPSQQNGPGTGEATSAAAQTSAPSQNSSGSNTPSAPTQPTQPGQPAQASSSGQQQQSGQNTQQKRELAQDFVVLNRNKVEEHLKDHFGIPIVVNFWASWCSPCCEELPYFELLSKQYAGKVDFMMVNMTDGISETTDSVDRFMQGSNFSFPVYFDEYGSASTTYNITSIPMTVFIRSDGSILDRRIGAMDQATLQSYLDQLV